MIHKLSIEVRFWARIKKGKPEECWPWQPVFVKQLKRDRESGDYGRFEHAWKTYKSHRLAWMLTHGEIPDGLRVLHKCDNPPCCNPNHLFLGTDLDNMRDCLIKGRMVKKPQKGSAHHNAKLNEDDVRFIRWAYKRGEITLLNLATWFGICQGQVSVIVNRKKWTHV